MVVLVTLAATFADGGKSWDSLCMGSLLLPFWFLLRTLLGPKFAPINLKGFSGMFMSRPKDGWVLLIGVAALVGIPPLPGFFFEDHVLVHLMGHSLWAVILIGTALGLNSIAGFRLFALVAMGIPAKNEMASNAVGLEVEAPENSRLNPQALAEVGRT